MAKLIVGFSRPSAWFVPGSWLIRLAEHSAFSHAFLRWDSESLDRDMIYQASHGMVHFISGPRFDDAETTIVAYEFDLADEAMKRVIQKAVDLAGADYGRLELIGMAIERYTGIKNPWRDGDKTFVCSELVGAVLEECNIAQFNLDLELAGPAKLERAVAVVAKRI